MNNIKNYFAEFTEIQWQQFAALKELYDEWNQKINVISRKDMENFYDHHVLHSLAIAAQFDFNEGMEVMDLGCGGGFPGIPLAIYFSGCRFQLVDSINKKLKVVNEVAAAIGLSNVTTHHGRAEEIKNRKFDAVVSRAVAPLKDLLKWSRPLLKKGKAEGGLICLKGGDLASEIAESNARPNVWALEEVFTEPFFKDKFLLQVRV